MEPETEIRMRHMFILILAGIGQTILFAFAWSIVGLTWAYKALHLPYDIVQLLTIWPSEVTLVVTLIGTVLSLLTTSFFSWAFKEALRHRMHNPISLLELDGGIALARGAILYTWNIPITLVTLVMFGLTQLMVSSWSTLLTPTFLGNDIPVGGTELNLNSNYFESQLYEQLLSAQVAIVSESNSLKIIDTEGLLSGIAAARLNFGVDGAVSFNGVSYNVTTGGVLPAAPGYLGTTLEAQSNDTRLAFVGGLVPSNLSPPPAPSLSSNYSIIQQGLTAQVTYTQVNNSNPVSTQSGSVSVSMSGGDVISLAAYSFQMECNEGNPAQEDYVIRSNNEGLPISSTGLVYSLVCPNPFNQSGLDWTRFNVTSGGAVSNKYAFLQLTTCEIIPQLTTSLVTYANDTLHVSVLDSTALARSNTNLSLYLASVIAYQAQSSQGLTSNTFADALYSVAVTSNTSLPTSGPMDPKFLSEMEQYWRGIVEFIATYLRSGFSAAPIKIEADGLRPYSGNQTITTIGWAQRSPIYLYTILPMTVFLILTYAAIIYVVYQLARRKGRKFTTFDPTNTLHLIMVSSTRESQPNVPGVSRIASDEKELDLEREKGGKVTSDANEQDQILPNLEGEKLGDFTPEGIQKNQGITVQLVDVGDQTMRKRFANLSQADSAKKEEKPDKNDRRCCHCGPRRPARNTEGATHKV